MVRFSTPLNTGTNTLFTKHPPKISYGIDTVTFAYSDIEIVLDEYCHWLSNVIFGAVHNELKFKYGIHADIDGYCSELTINIFKCVYMDLVELLCGKEKLYAPWSANNHNVRQIAFLHPSCENFQKPVACEFMQSLPYLTDQESMSIRHPGNFLHSRICFQNKFKILKRSVANLVKLMDKIQGIKL